MSRELPLQQLQRSFMEAVTNPATASSDAEAIILPSPTQSASQRLAVYQNAYTARLIEVLRELFPCTRYATGDELFDQFAVGYLHNHPPWSYTLAHLADRWVDYLATTRPSDWGAFLVELSCLEQAIDRIFDAPGSEKLPSLALPANADEALRLEFVPGFELHAFTYPVSSYFTAWKRGSAPAWPVAETQFVALFRRDYIVRRIELRRSQYDLLRALHCGMPLGQALNNLLEGDGFQNNGLGNFPAAAEVKQWFTAWSAQRFFAAAF